MYRDSLLDSAHLCLIPCVCSTVFSGYCVQRASWTTESVVANKHHHDSGLFGGSSEILQAVPLHKRHITTYSTSRPLELEHMSAQMEASAAILNSKQ